MEYNLLLDILITFHNKIPYLVLITKQDYKLVFLHYYIFLPKLYITLLLNYGTSIKSHFKDLDHFLFIVTYYQPFNLYLRILITNLPLVINLLYTFLDTILLKILLHDRMFYNYQKYHELILLEYNFIHLLQVMLILIMIIKQ